MHCVCFKLKKKTPRNFAMAFDRLVVVHGLRNGRRQQGRRVHGLWPNPAECGGGIGLGKQMLGWSGRGRSRPGQCREGGTGTSSVSRSIRGGQDCENTKALGEVLGWVLGVGVCYGGSLDSPRAPSIWVRSVGFRTPGLIRYNLAVCD